MILGEIFLKRLLDCDAEYKFDDVIYILVTTEDSSNISMSSNASVIINVENTNDNYPVFTKPSTGNETEILLSGYDTDTNDFFILKIPQEVKPLNSGVFLSAKDRDKDDIIFYYIRHISGKTFVQRTIHHFQ